MYPWPPRAFGSARGEATTALPSSRASRPSIRAPSIHALTSTRRVSLGSSFWHARGAVTDLCCHADLSCQTTLLVGPQAGDCFPSLFRVASVSQAILFFIVNFGGHLIEINPSLLKRFNGFVNIGFNELYNVFPAGVLPLTNTYTEHGTFLRSGSFWYNPTTRYLFTLLCSTNDLSQRLSDRNSALSSEKQ